MYSWRQNSPISLFSKLPPTLKITTADKNKNLAMYEFIRGEAGSFTWGCNFLRIITIYQKY